MEASRTEAYRMEVYRTEVYRGQGNSNLKRAITTKGTSLVVIVSVLAMFVVAISSFLVMPLFDISSPSRV